MEFSSQSPQQKETVKSPSRQKQVIGTWIHVITEIFTRSWQRLATMLVLGIFNMIAQITAIATVVGIAQAISSDGLVSLFGINFQLPLTREKLFLAVAVATISLLIASFCQYLVGILTAQYRKDYFAILIKRALSSLQELGVRGKVIAFPPKIFARLLRRECRYLSRSYVAAIGIVPPLVTFIGVLIFSIWNFSGYALLLIVLLIISSPLHLSLATWGANVSSDLVRSARQKAQADEKIVGRLIAHPFSQRLNEKSFDEHVESAAVSNFLNAYKNRMRLGALSQFVSSIIGVLALTVLVAVFVEKFLRGNLEIAGVVFVIISFRLLLTNAASVAQGFAVVGSFQPFVQSLLELLGANTVTPTPRTLSQEATGSMVVVFEPHPVSILNARQLHTDFRPTKTSVRTTLVYSGYDLSSSNPRIALGLSENEQFEDILDWLPELTQENREALRKFLDIHTVTSDDWDELPAALKTIFAMKSALQEENATVVAVASSILALNRHERNALLSIAGRRLIVMIYQSIPKRLAVHRNVNLFASREDTLEFVGFASEFDDLRETIQDILDEERQRLEAKYFQFDDDENEAPI